MPQMFKLENSGVALYDVVEKTRNEFTFCSTAAIYINEERIRGNMYDIRSTEL